MMYKSIDELSIYLYNKIVDKSDTGYLNKQYAPGNDLTDVYWQKIVNEYTIATSHREGNAEIFELKHNILDITVEYNNIKAFCSVLRNNWNLDVVAKLDDYGHTISSITEISRVEQSIGALLTTKREYEFQLASMLTTGGKSVTFEQILDRISSHQKIRLNPREITVKEWIAIEDNYMADLRKN